MKIIGGFTRHSRREPIAVDGKTYAVTWEAEPGYVEIRGISEVKLRVDDDAGQPVVFMRWLVADVRAIGGKEEVFDALESHSPDGADWSACLRRNCAQCAEDVETVSAIALLSLIVTASPYQGRGLGTPLARAFAEQVLGRSGVSAIWIKPVPLREHPTSGVFKPLFDPDTAAFRVAKDRLERHYESSLDAKWTCPDYLRVDLGPR